MEEIEKTEKQENESNSNIINEEITNKSIDSKTEEVKENVNEIENIKEINMEDKNVTIDVSGYISWQDKENADGIRPNIVTVYIRKNNIPNPVIILKVSKENNWKFIVKNLPKYNELGEEITYHIAEATPPGYSYIVNGTTLLNSHYVKDRIHDNSDDIVDEASSNNNILKKKYEKELIKNEKTNKILLIILLIICLIGAGSIGYFGYIKFLAEKSPDYGNFQLRFPVPADFAGEKRMLTHPH